MKAHQLSKGQGGGFLLLLLLGLVLCVAQLAIADDSWLPEQDGGYGDKTPYTQQKYKGFYNGLPYNDDDGDEPVYTTPYSPNPIYKPVPKPKPSYTKPVSTPIYSKPSSYPAHYYKKNHTKPHTTKPIYPKKKPLPSYTNPVTEPTYSPPIYEPVPVPESEATPPYNEPVPEYQSKPSPPAPEPPTTSYPTSPASSSEQDWLAPHNAARAAVGVPPLVWSDEVAGYAQSWANQRQAAGCGLVHSSGPYGENIFWGSGDGYGPADCVAAWVQEKQYYNYADNSCAGGQDCGHYTQIVWASSARLGCAKVECDSGAVFMTCNYDPPGNYIGTKPY